MLIKRNLPPIVIIIFTVCKLGQCRLHFKHFSQVKQLKSKIFKNYLTTFFQTTNSGQVISLTCLATTGNISLPSPLPVCRNVLPCPTPPTPPVSSQLQASISTTVNEYQVSFPEKSYEHCKNKMIKNGIKC